MRYEVIPRRVTLLIYDETYSDINYVASCQVNINGTKGTIDTLNGKDFYKFLQEYGLKPFKDLGLNEVSAAVSLLHLRLIKRMLGSIIHIEEVGEPFKIGKAEVIYIRMTEA
jgi:hypothetical protein